MKLSQFSLSTLMLIIVLFGHIIYAAVEYYKEKPKRAVMLGQVIFGSPGGIYFVEFKDGNEKFVYYTGISPLGPVLIRTEEPKTNSK